MSRARSRRSSAIAMLGFAVYGAMIASCAPAEDRASTPIFAGVELPTPLAKPAFTLIDTKGRPYDFLRETRGRLTLLSFGYTHCPDVCPVQMANIAAVLGKLEWKDRSRIMVIFITTDPKRDTPARLRAWLDNFDPDFVGLRGTTEEIHRIESSVGVSQSIEIANGADYGIGHAAQVLAFTPDDSLRVLYPFGVRQQDWASDIPKLLAVSATR